MVLPVTTSREVIYGGDEEEITRWREAVVEEAMAETHRNS